MLVVIFVYVGVDQVVDERDMFYHSHVPGFFIGDLIGTVAFGTLSAEGVPIFLTVEALLLTPEAPSPTNVPLQLQW